MAHEALGRASQQQKRQYDIKTRRRQFHAGEKVLVLRPSKNNKLELAWKGPYKVIERKGEADYKIQMEREAKILHANLLKLFIERGEDTVSKMVAVRAVVVEEEKEETTAITSKDIPVMPLEATEGPQDIKIRTEDGEFARMLRELADEFGDILTDVPSCTNLEVCRVQLKDDATVRSRPYTVPFSQRETIDKEIDQMLKMGVIEPSTSSYASPIVLVKKKDGKMRFCIDYRKLNKVVEFDTEPKPEIYYLFSKLGKKEIFSKIDLSKGYWQIPVAVEDKPKTAFITPKGCFQWKVMPFGLCTSGAVFSRMMRKLLLPLDSETTDNFIDDILVATEGKEEHVQELRKLLQRLRECSLTARPSKCEIGCEEIEYLGFKVGHGKISPVEDKMAKIREAKRPMTKKEVRSFLGLVGFYRRFVPHFAEIALPLTNLTKKRGTTSCTLDARVRSSVLYPERHVLQATSMSFTYHREQVRIANRCF